MKTREPWQHDWSPAFRVEVVDGQERVVKPCRRSECGWEMLSRKNSNRYRNGPDGAWMGSPKDCKGSDGPILEPHPAASIMAWPKEKKP